MSIFNIVALGPKGAGKTVFLASMFNALYQMRREYGFRLEVEGKATNTTTKEQDAAIKRNILIKNYQKIESPGRDWPQKTKDITDFTFACYVSPENNDQPYYLPCQFSYTDYQGAYVSYVDDMADDLIPGEEMLPDKVAKANLLLGILDGDKIVDNILDPSKFNQEERLAWEADLKNVLAYMTISNAPAYFIISKWDVIESSKYSLSAVKEKLLEIRDFKDFVADKSQRQKQAVRLIPVSAVGSGYVRKVSIDGDQVMEKLPNKKPHPYNVEVPLAFALDDMLQSYTVQPQYNWWEKAAPNFAFGVKLVAGVILRRDTPETNKVSERFENWIMKSRNNKNQLSEQEKKAINLICDRFQAIQKSIIDKYPESDLSNIG